MSKIKNKILKKLAGSNFANMLVDSGPSYLNDKLERLLLWPVY